MFQTFFAQYQCINTHHLSERREGLSLLLFPYIVIVGNKGLILFGKGIHTHVSKYKGSNLLNIMVEINKSAFWNIAKGLSVFIFGFPPPPMP